MLFASMVQLIMNPKIYYHSKTNINQTYLTPQYTICTKNGIIFALKNGKKKNKQYLIVIGYQIMQIMMTILYLLQINVVIIYLK